MVLAPVPVVQLPFPDTEPNTVTPFPVTVRMSPLDMERVPRILIAPQDKLPQVVTVPLRMVTESVAAGTPDGVHVPAVPQAPPVLVLDAASAASVPNMRMLNNAATR